MKTGKKHIGAFFGLVGFIFLFWYLNYSVDKITHPILPEKTTRIVDAKIERPETFIEPFSRYLIITSENGKFVLFTSNFFVWEKIKSGDKVRGAWQLSKDGEANKYMQDYQIEIVP